MIVRERAELRPESHPTRPLGGFEPSAEVIKTGDSDRAGLSALRDNRREHAEQESPEAETSSRTVLDSLTAHLAVLDLSGTIVAVNRAWRNFAAANAPDGAHVSEGANYLRVCDEAEGEAAEAARAFAA